MRTSPARALSARSAFGALAVLSALTLPALMATSSPGCLPTPEKLNDLCGFVDSPENCFATFANDIDATCGAEVTLSADGQSLEGTRKGSFLKGTPLDVCVLAAGGQVVFDPPLDAEGFPPATLAFKLINDQGAECGSGSADLAGADSADPRQVYAFSVTVKGFNTDPPPPAAGDAGAPDAGDVLTCSDLDDLNDPGGDLLLCGGTYAASKVADREIVETTCPSGQTYRFNLLQRSKCSTAFDKGDVLANTIPRAIVEVEPSLVDKEGRVTFSVVYPVHPESLSEPPPANGELRERIVNYFECAIPSLPRPCQNGVQDLAETDIDCGGQTEIFEAGVCDCPRCGDGQKCFDDGDCASGFVCTLDKGLRKCVGAPTGGMGGTGGTGGAMGTPVSPDKTLCGQGSGGAGGAGGAGG